MATAVTGAWASQVYATSIYAPLFLGWGLSACLFGLFVGRCIAYYQDEELWKEQTRAYRAFLVLLGFLLAAYQAIVFEEASYWGGEWDRYAPAGTELTRPVSVVSQNRSLEQMVAGHPLGNAIPVLGGLIGLLVQIALSLRASALFTTRRSRAVFLCTVAVCALSAFAGCIMVTASGVMVSERCPSSAMIHKGCPSSAMFGDDSPLTPLNPPLSPTVLPAHGNEHQHVLQPSHRPVDRRCSSSRRRHLYRPAHQPAEEEGEWEKEKIWFPASATTLRAGYLLTIPSPLPLPPRRFPSRPAITSLLIAFCKRLSPDTPIRRTSILAPRADYLCSSPHWLFEQRPTHFSSRSLA